MRQTHPIAIALLSLALSVPAYAAENAAAPLVQQQLMQEQAFAQQRELFLQDLWRNDPDMAMSAGKFDAAANMAIPDQAAHARNLKFFQRWQQQFSQFADQALSDNARTDLALIRNYLQSGIWYLTEFRDYEWDPTQYNIGWSFDAILTTDYAPKAERVRTLIQRLQFVPAYYRAAQHNIVRPTREHTHLAIQQSAGALTVLGELEKQAAEVKLSSSEQTLLRQRLAAARAAVRQHTAWLEKLEQGFTDANTRSFRIGKALYERKFAADIQSSYTAEQAYQRAVQAKQEMHANMDRIADTLWPKYMGEQPKPADKLQKIGMLIDKLSEKHVRREDFIPAIRTLLPQIQDWIIQHDLVDIDPAKPLVVRETPEYERGVTGASIEAARPLRPQDQTYFNVDPLDRETPEQAESTLREYNHWILQILAIHEALPGHYVQLQHANKSPSLVKAVFGNGAMIEGWAVYSERMMMESGYGGNTPEMWLMYSKWNLRTICNTILDYSIHVLGMSEADAKEFLTRQAFQTQSEADGKWLRAQYSSVQLTSYFSGYSELYEFREQRKQALGDKFDLKQFHEQFLSYGSAPIKMIKQLMLDKAAK
jgi:uncharacterized protein (DUF885 family)